MKCPFCASADTQVIDSRVSEAGDSIRRRRRCVACKKRFTTYENAELRMPQVVKADGSRADFEESKLRVGFQRALHKRPVPTEYVDAAIKRIFQHVLSIGEREIPSREIGERVMEELKKLDKVAYIRFASVYRSFQDISDFQDAIKEVERPRVARAVDAMTLSAAQPDDRVFMARALALAERGLYTTTPNPRVGSVVVRDGEVIGEGFHERPGEPHAEAAALADAQRRHHDVRGATVYVNLEPCNHHGRTGPCSRALIDAGVARVVFAMRDPYPPAQGGAAALAAAGIDVTEGVMEDEARDLNIGFVSNVTRGTPWVRSKLAASLDGRTALVDGQSQWITGREARADGHAWRARACAILTGIGTVIQDNPWLTVRDIETPRQPLRVIVDRRGEMPADARVLADANALIVTGDAPAGKSFGNVEVLALPNAQGRVDLAALLHVLAQRGINEVHVEAGAKLNGALLDAGLIDEMLVYLAPSILGDPARGMAEYPSPLSVLSARVPLSFHRIDRIGGDLRVIARVRRDFHAEH